MKHSILFLLFVTVFVGCKNKLGSDSVTVVDWSDKEVNLVATELKMDISEFEPWPRPSLFEDILVLRDLYHPTNLLVAYKIKKDSLIFENVIARRGRSGTEWLSPPELFRVDDGRFFMAGGNTNRVSISIDRSIGALSRLADWENFSIPSTKEAEYVSTITPYHDNPYNVYGTMASSKYNTTGYEFNVKDSVITPLFIDYPPHKEKMEPEVLWGYLLGSNIYNKPNTNRFLYHTLAGEYVYLFDKKGRNIEIVKYLYNNPPKTTDKQGVFPRSIDSANSFGFEIFTTNDLIYMQDCTAGSNKQFIEEGIKIEGVYPGFFSKIIYVYDWDGNPIRKYVLDHYVLDLVVDEKNNCIYTSTLNPETEETIFLRYDLPEL